MKVLNFDSSQNATCWWLTYYNRNNFETILYGTYFNYTINEQELLLSISE